MIVCIPVATVHHVCMYMLYVHTVHNIPYCIHVRQYADPLQQRLSVVVAIVVAIIETYPNLPSFRSWRERAEHGEHRKVPFSPFSSTLFIIFRRNRIDGIVPASQSLPGREIPQDHHVERAEKESEKCLHRNVYRETVRHHKS